MVSKGEQVCQRASQRGLSQPEGFDCSQEGSEVQLWGFDGKQEVSMGLPNGSEAS